MRIDEEDRTLLSISIFIRQVMVENIIILIICYAQGSKNKTWYNKNTKTVS